MAVVLCISSYYKGYDFMQASKALGNEVYLVTSESLRDAHWPWESLDDVFYMHEVQPYKWNMMHLIEGIAHFMRSKTVDIVVALDDFDVEKAAEVREVFRIPGMGQTTHRYFRDKLAMRQMAEDNKIQVPAFTAVFNDEAVRQFTKEVSGPWVLKPRSEASATGIKKIYTEQELWQQLQNLGTERYKYLIEQFKPGYVYHVDSLIHNGKVIFAVASRYVLPPMTVVQEGGVFMSQTLSNRDRTTRALLRMNKDLIKKFGLVNGTTHSEFIQCKETGEFYFLETASRVGGAFLADMVEVASGINLWKEWAAIENAVFHNTDYQLPEHENNFAGLLVSLSKVETPDLSYVTDDEFAKQVFKDYHVGMIFLADKKEKIDKMLEKHSVEVREKFLSIIPPKEYPTS
ncbi:MAG: ATP-grasp domain-containing protein [Weeksellaceae bacterium]|nr:ATP-grasp domain-containing protein [Weeksellaceae bacterium]